MPLFLIEKCYNIKCICVFQVALEVAAAPVVSLLAADRCPGPAGAGCAFLAAE